MIKSICVYCGSSPGRREAYLSGAKRLAQVLVEENIQLVYGGAQIGVMGALADAVLEHGGKVIGVIPQNLLKKEVAHPGLTDLQVVGSMHERKAQMVALSDGFIALPGGIGTLEELFEVLTWAQLGLHKKPCGLLNIEGYYDRLTDFVNHMVTEEFVKSAHRSILMVENTPEQLLEGFRKYQAPYVKKWISKTEI